MATTHVSSASELKAALGGAKGGDTILVKSGSYGWVTLDNFKFNDYVTIKSADGNGGAVFKHIGLNNTSHIRLDGLTMEFGTTPLHHLKAIEVRKTDHLQVVNSEIIGHDETKDWKELPRGIHVWDGSSDIEVLDNHFHHFGRAVFFQGVKNINIKDNLIDNIKSDGIVFQNSHNLIVEDNILTNFYRQGADHADYIQFDPGTSGTSRDVVIRGNVMLKGKGNGDVQGIFGASHHADVHKTVFTNFVIENNIYFDTGLNSVQLYSGNNITVRNNTVLTDPADGRVGWVRLTGPQTNSVIENNVALQVNAEGGATASGNIIVQYKDPSKPNYYGNLFSNPFADPASLADLAPKPGTPVGYGSGKGAEKLFQELLGGADPTPANTAPVAADDTAATAQGSLVTIDVLANDADDDGDALAVTSVGEAANGTVTRNADGTVSYAPAAGFTGTDRFTYTVSDGNGGSDTASVSVTVAGAAGAIPAPVLASDAQSFNGTKGATLILPHQQAYEVASGTLELAFTADAVSGRRALFSKDALNFGTGGHLTIQIEDGALIVRLQSKTQSFTMTARDAVTAGQQHHAAITFGPEGLKLYLDGVLTATNAYTGGLAGNAEPVVIGASQTTSGEKAADVLSDFFVGTIATVALYNQALPAAAIATLNGEGVSNTAPVAADDTAATAQGSPVTIDVLANDADDDGDALTVASVGQDAGGTVTLNADGTATYTPAAGFTGADSFTYTVSDGKGGTDTAKVTVNVDAAPAVVAAINAGGSAFTAADGTAFSADTSFSGGKTYSNTAAIAGTTDDALYQSERYGNFSHAVAVADGTYNVTLQFAEIYWGAAGKRMFDVTAEGKLVLDNLDIFSVAGGKNIAYDVTIPVAVSDGILNLDFITVKDNAKISAIQIANVLGDSFDAIATVALSDTLADLADPLLA